MRHELTQGGEAGGQIGQMAAGELAHRGGPPGEAAAVPVVVSLVEEGPGRGLVGLLAEAFHGVTWGIVPVVEDGAELHVTVARVGAIGGNAEDADPAGLGGAASRSGEQSAPAIGAGDAMVRGHDRHDRLGIAAEEDLGGQGDAGGRVARAGFCENVLLRQFGQVSVDQMRLGGGGDHEDALHGNVGGEALRRVLEQARLVEEAQVLLGKGLAARRPEAGSRPARHDHGPEMLVAHGQKLTFPAASEPGSQAKSSRTPSGPRGSR